LSIEWLGNSLSGGHQLLVVRLSGKIEFTLLRTQKLEGLREFTVLLIHHERSLILISELESIRANSMLDKSVIVMISPLTVYSVK